MDDSRLVELGCKVTLSFVFWRGRNHRFGGWPGLAPLQVFGNRYVCVWVHSQAFVFLYVTFFTDRQLANGMGGHQVFLQGARDSCAVQIHH